jgi:hypothetical protein
MTAVAPMLCAKAATRRGSASGRPRRKRAAARDVEGDGPLVLLRRDWRRDGLAGEEVSWSVGYGPRTRAWVFKPARASGPLPGVVALHHHGGIKYCGKEKIADGPEDPPPAVAALRTRHYEGRVAGGPVQTPARVNVTCVTPLGEEVASTS